MSANSEISWTHHTFNIAWGCVEASLGCDACYARAWARRYGVAWGVGAERRTFGAKYWANPVRWNTKAAKAGVPARVFCSSMTDLFLNDPVIDAEREKLWPLIRSTPHLIWQLLTKHPERIKANLPSDWGEGYANVVLMTTVEHDSTRWRIRTLQGVPAIARGLSCEPLVGPVDLRGQLDGIHWVIVGGESGATARPMHWLWPRAIRDAAIEANVAFHFKQHGAWLSRGILGSYVPLTMDRRHAVVFPDGSTIRTQAELRALDRDAVTARFAAGDGSLVERMAKKAAGRDLDGRTWDEFPQIGAAA